MNFSGPTVYVCVVHWQTDDWIDIQLKYFQEYLPNNHKVFAFLNGISNKHYDKFYRVWDEPIVDHATKLNILAEEVVKVASEDDVLLFIDGDAIPVGEMDVRINNWLESSSLVAVQRLENRGDIQPHPCFCLMKVKTWVGLSGDWSPGYSWRDDRGMQTTDVGGNLLGKLESSSKPWTPLLRSNKNNTHPLWFGVYGGCVYHHGAGFRERNSRLDQSYLRRLLSLLAPKKLKNLVRKYSLQEKIFNMTKDRYSNISEEIIADLKKDFNFFKNL